MVREGVPNWACEGNIVVVAKRRTDGGREREREREEREERERRERSNSNTVQCDSHKEQR